MTPSEDDFTAIEKSANLDTYKDIPYFELLELAEKERDIEKRKALFELSNTILEREFKKFTKPKHADGCP